MSWDLLPFEDLYQIPSRNGLTRPARVRGTGYKMINMGELFANDRIGDIDMELVPMKDRELANCLVQEGDLLFARQSLVLAGAGKCSIVKEVTEPTTFESHIIRVRLNKELADPNFYYYYFRSPASRMRSIVTQGVQAGIRSNDLKKLQVHRPDLGEQQRISKYLEGYDDLIENCFKRIELLEDAASQLFKEWFVRFRFPGHEHVKVVAGIPENWSKTTLGSIADTNVNNFSKRNLPDNINYVDISSVSQGRILNKSRLSSLDAPGRARRIAHHGDIIWSNVRPNLRAYALVLWPDEIDVFSTGFSILTPRKVPFSYLYQIAKTDAFVGHLVNHTTGASYPAVRPPDFERAEVILPCSMLLDQFHSIVEPMHHMAFKLEQEIRAAAIARDLVLPKLMNREIAV